MGRGEVGLMPDRLAEFGDGLVQLPLGRRARPRLPWARGSSGLSRIASRSSATASSSFPWSARAFPRLIWGAAWSGRSRTASRAAATARSRNGTASAARPFSFRWLPRQARCRAFSGRQRQVAEDRLGLGAAAHPLEQVGQLVRRLGAEGAGRRVVPHRLLAGRGRSSSRAPARA